MAKLQNDFTTPEQTERLLELGVPAWTANIMFDKNRRRYELIETEDESWAETQITLFYNGGAIPHWSVGRLIEIFDICFSIKKEKWPTTTDMTKTSGSVIEYLVTTFEIQPRCKLDFSKLELNN